MSNIDSDDICTDGDCPKEVTTTRFSSLSNKETLLIENPQTRLSSCTTEETVPTVTVGKMSPMISIPKEQYELLCAELKSKDQKLKALKNIHLLIQEKDEEVSSLKEKNQTYADALMMSEVRHCQLLRIATRFAKDNAGSDVDQKQKTSSTNDSAKEISDQDLNKSVQTVSLQDLKIDNPKDNVMNTLEEDCEILNNETHASALSEDSVRENMSLETDAALIQNNLPLDGFTRTYLESDLKETDHALNRNASDDAVQKAMEEEDQAESTHQQLLNPRGFPMPKYALPKKFPGVSQDLVNKLIRQNARLKQILRQVMSSQGIGVEDYLERQEYASVVEQLRQELKLSRNRVKDLEELLASVGNQDTDGLRTRNLQLQETLQRQNKMLAVKQAMVDAFSRRCEEMEHQLKQVKLQSLMEDDSSLSRNTPEIAASDKMATKTFATNTLWQKPHSESSSSKGLHVGGATDGKQEQVTEKSDAFSHAPLIASSAVVSAVGIGSSLVCKRCDREFDESDDEKYREHCIKCTDD